MSLHDFIDWCYVELLKSNVFDWVDDARKTCFPMLVMMRYR